MGDPRESWEPSDARGYSWPPFEAGNEASLRHGGFSDQRRRPLEEALTVWALEVAPHLTESHAGAAVAAWARSEAMVELMAAWVSEQPGLVDEDGNALPVLAQLDRYERLALKHRQQLGLDPRSRLELMRESAELERVASDLDAVAAAGASSLAARRAELAPVAQPVSDDPGDQA